MEHEHEALHAGRVEPDHVDLRMCCLAAANSSSVSSPARCISARRWSSPTICVLASAPSEKCGVGAADGAVKGGGTYGGEPYCGDGDRPGNTGLAALTTVRAVGRIASGSAWLPDPSLQKVALRNVRDLSASNGNPPISTNSTPHTIQPALAPCSPG